MIGFAMDVWDWVKKSKKTQSRSSGDEKSIPQQEGITPTPTGDITPSQTGDRTASNASPEVKEKPLTTEPKDLEKTGTLPLYQNEENPTFVKRLNGLIRPIGESGRSWFHPRIFLRVCFRSNTKISKHINRFWPLVPTAIILHWAKPEQQLANFILPYLAMIPSANLLGFSSGQLAIKLPHVAGVIFETTMGSVVEIVLFIVLIKEGPTSVPIIKSAILGSILANLLLCLGACFIAGGMGRKEQIFHEAISEVGSNLMLVAGMGLIIPSVFSASLTVGESSLAHEVVQISRATAVILLVAYIVYIYFQTTSHENIYIEVLESEETEGDRAKLTFTEALVALLFSLAMVTFMAVFLVKQIDYLVTERHVKEAFLGLILVPVVEKAAEHLSAIEESMKDQANMALSHVLGSSVQTALLNTPLVVIIGWGLDIPMDLNFQIFDSAVLILAILVVGNMLRDKKSDYLEGVLCVLVYAIIAICAFFYPDQHGTE